MEAQACGMCMGSITEGRMMMKRCIAMMMAMGLGLAAQAAVTNQWTLINGDWSDTNLWESVPIPQNIDDVALLKGNIGGSRTVSNDLASLTLGGLEIGRNFNLQQRYVKLIGNAVTFESSTGTAYLYKPVPGVTGTPNQNSIIETDIILKSNLTIENVHPYDLSYLLLSGTISETGGVRSITIDAGGSTRLYGANSYSGGTTLNSGLLRVYDDEALGTGALDIQSGAMAFFSISGQTLANDISNAGDMLLIGNAILSGDISGSGSLTHEATGGFTLKLLGDNAGFSGSISNTAILQIGHENALGSGTVYLGNGTDAGNLSKAVGSHFYLTGDHAIENNIVLLNDGNSVGNNQAPMELAGTISGDFDLTKYGSGTVVLSGNNTYTGDTTVDTGSLVVDGGLLGSLTVNAGGTLGGGGTIGGGVVFEDGALWLFDPVSTLTVDGSVSFADFGVEDIVGLDSDTELGTYTLIDGLVDFTNIGNKTFETAFDLGGGKSAYFEEGSLNLVVVPEPVTLSLVVAMGGGLLWLRRVFMV